MAEANGNGHAPDAKKPRKTRVWCDGWFVFFSHTFLLLSNKEFLQAFVQIQTRTFCVLLNLLTLPHLNG